LRVVLENGDHSGEIEMTGYPTLRVLLRSVAFLFLISNAAHAQPNSGFSGSFVNGRTWNEWDQDMRVAYVFGFTEGAHTALLDSLGSAQGQKQALAKLIDGFGPGEIAAQIDRIYREPANLLIPIWAAYAIAKKQFEGGSAEEIAGLIVAMRKAGLELTMREGHK
jgi:hypothetical protein